MSHTLHPRAGTIPKHEWLRSTTWGDATSTGRTEMDNEVGASTFASTQLVDTINALAGSHFPYVGKPPYTRKFSAEISSLAAHPLLDESETAQTLAIGAGQVMTMTHRRHQLSMPSSASDGMDGKLNTHVIKLERECFSALRSGSFINMLS